MPKFAPKNQILKKKKHKLVLVENRILPSDILLLKVQNERAARIMEKDNTLAFKCRTSATKTEIKNAFIELYNQEIMKVNIVNTVKGYKKAYIRLKEPGAAIRLASEAGMI